MFGREWSSSGGCLGRLTWFEYVCTFYLPVLLRGSSMKRAQREAVARKRVCSLKAEPCDGDEPVLAFALDSDSDAFESGAVEEVGWPEFRDEPFPQRSGEVVLTVLPGQSRKIACGARLYQHISDDISSSLKPGRNFNVAKITQ